MDCSYLSSGETRLLGQLMAGSHATMKDDFEITKSELDTLVEIMAKVLADKGGARMTGGGSGLAVVPSH